MEAEKLYNKTKFTGLCGEGGNTFKKREKLYSMQYHIPLFLMHLGKNDIVLADNQNKFCEHGV